MKTALVTGSAGFVGRHLVPKLLKEGYFTCCVDPKSQVNPLKAEAFIRNTEFLQANNLLPEPWKSGPRFDVVVHLAANIEDVDARSKGSLKVYQDIPLDYQMCEYIEQNPPREAFIMMSSCAVDYPDDPYAWVKLTLEQFAKRLDKQGIPIVVLRPFSGYSGNQAPSYPFPAILGRALRREDPLTVWGSLNTVRDWLHIDDLTDAILWAIKSAPRGATPIEIGTGVPTAFWQLAYNIAHAIPYYPRIEALSDKAASSGYRVADPEPAAKLGWQATISLAEGIRQAVSAYKEQR